MFFWTPYSFVRIVLFLIAGILLGIYNPDLLSEKIALVLCAALILIYFYLLFGKQFINPGYIGLSIIFLSGYLNTLYKTDSRNPSHFINNQISTTQYKVVITSHAEEKDKSWKTEASILAVKDSNAWITCSGKVLLYFSKNDFASPFAYGDVLLLSGSPSDLKGPANPGEFDYKRFLSFRKIYHQHFLRKNQVLYVTNEPPWSIMAYSIRARIWAEEVIRKHIKGEQERAVAFALILGVKDGLDNDLVHAYSSSGAMHVLAVSGLHVGIIYLIINFLLLPLKHRKHGKVVLAVVSFMLLWCYAFITGLSPSVLRAVTMFSFMALARPFNYSGNIFNTLAVSAFCLLMWEPFFIMSVGFQLSFIAVVGIVYLQPKLYQRWIPESYLLDKIWQITCVSIAAQLATFSLSILYFHQFPVYFLVSNLFVIPGALVSLSLGLLLLASSAFQPIAYVVGNLLEGVLWLLNYLVFTVERLPFSLIDNIYITTLQSWLLLIMVVSLVLLIQFRKFAYVLSFAGCGLSFGFIQWQHHVQSSDSMFVVYQVNGHSAFEWVENRNSYFFADSVLLNDREKLRFHIRPNRLHHGVQAYHPNPGSFISYKEGARIYKWNTALVFQVTHDHYFFPEGLEVDYLVLSNNAVRDLRKLATVKFKTLIVDSSNSIWTANKIMQQASELGIAVHSVLHQGAFVTKL